MTKTVIIRSCYILIALWLFGTIGLLFPLQYYGMILTSIDEDTGCRISLKDSNNIICPDLPIKEQADTRGYSSYVCSTCEEGFMQTESNIQTKFVIPLTVQIIIQIVALLSWNSHYKWFRVELKSCWSGKNE